MKEQAIPWVDAQDGAASDDNFVNVDVLRIMESRGSDTH